MKKEIEHVPKQVPVNEGWEEHVLAEPIYKLEGGRNILLLREGWKLTPSNIRSLQRHEVKTMVILVEKPREPESNEQQSKDESNQDEEGG